MAIAAFLIGSATTGHAEEKTLRFGFILSNASQLGSGANVFAAEIANATDGRYRIETYPDAMLGGEVAMMHDVQIGALDLAFITGAPLPKIVPAAGIFNIPFLFRDVGQARAVLDGPIGDEYLAKFDKAGLVALAWGENGMRHLTTSQRSVADPDDLKGLRLRLPQSDTMTVGFKALGAEVQQIPFNQLYGALQSGRVEAEENPIATILASRFAQVQTHLTLTAHVYDPAVILMSRDAFDALSETDRQIFRAAAKRAGQTSRDIAAAKERTGVETLRAAGMIVIDRVDRAAFAKRVAAAMPVWNASFGTAEIDRIKEYRAVSTTSPAVSP